MKKLELLSDILKHGITVENAPLLDELVRHELDKAKRKHEKRNAINASFRNEIWDVLAREYGRPMTATDIQFAITDFIPRKITNQKVASHLRNMVYSPDYTIQRIKVHNTVYFIAGTEIPNYLRTAIKLASEEVW